MQVSLLARLNELIESWQECLELAALTRDPSLPQDRSLRAILKQHQPTVCIIEGLFFAQNLQTALIMGEARGAAIAAIAEAGLANRLHILVADLPLAAQHLFGKSQRSRSARRRTATVAAGDDLLLFETDQLADGRMGG